MLTRKIVCCASLFSIMLMLGWRLEQSMTSLVIDMHNRETLIGEHSFHSAYFSEPIPLSIPFLPREYVRIKHKAD